MPALEIYRTRFQRTSVGRVPLEQPYVMPGLSVVAADTDDEARRLFTSHQQVFLALRRGQLGPVPPPVDPDKFEAELTPIERAELGHVFSSAIVGSPSTVLKGVREFLRRTNADELIISSQIYDHNARLRSFEIIAGIRTHLDIAAVAGA
jgi:alkanesulfonate monooxygenase SsuD/methylene tetrahydromethanopterin reductase-like flavin-dependent oxidoreductase (luciferase family)